MQNSKFQKRADNTTMAHRNLLNRKTAENVTEQLAKMKSIGPNITLKKFIEANTDNFQRLIVSGATISEIYLFLREECELNLGSLANFRKAWRKCKHQQVSQHREEEEIQDSTNKPQEPEPTPEVRTPRKRAGLPREKLPDGREIIIKDGCRTFEI